MGRPGILFPTDHEQAGKTAVVRGVGRMARDCRTATRSARTAPTLCPGREAGVSAVFGLTPDRNSAADFGIQRASGWIADCSSTAGAQAMNADRVIKSNADLFNTRTWAGGIWRKDTISARGDNV